MKIRVYFSDMSILECMDVNHSRKFWRFVSKHIKYNKRMYGETVRVIKVEKGVNII